MERKGTKDGSGGLVELVMGTTAAADKVMKGVITYDLPQVDKLCSHYYLMR